MELVTKNAAAARGKVDGHDARIFAACAVKELNDRLLDRAVTPARQSVSKIKILVVVVSSSQSHLHQRRASEESAAKVRFQTYPQD